MSKKGKIIAISVIAYLVVCFLLCIFVVMSVRSTKINFLYQTDINEAQVTKALDDAGVIPYGKSAIFVNKQEVQQNIEKAYPKLKVYNIEFEFPNVVKVNCAERIGIFCVSVKSGKTYVVDSELKVIEEATEDQKNNLTTLSFDTEGGYQEVALNSVKMAEVLGFDYASNCASLFVYISKSQFNLSQFNKLFEKVQVVQGYDKEHKKIEKLIFHTNTAKKVIFENVTINMQQRFNKLYDIAINPDKYSSDEIEIAY